jgi:hypothetical protein
MASILGHTDEVAARQLLKELEQIQPNRSEARLKLSKFDDSVH